MSWLDLAKAVGLVAAILLILELGPRILAPAEDVCDCETCRAEREGKNR